jgi:hypothetical protein
MGFYQSKEWKRLRAQHIKRFPLCAVKGCGAKAKIVDHIVSVKRAPNRKLDPLNLQSLCAFHHGVITAAYDKDSIAGQCDVDGYPMDPNHPWNQSGNAAAIATVNSKAKPDPLLTVQFKRKLSDKRK